MALSIYQSVKLREDKTNSLLATGSGAAKATPMIKAMMVVVVNFIFAAGGLCGEGVVGSVW